MKQFLIFLLTALCCTTAVFAQADSSQLITVDSVDIRNYKTGTDLAVPDIPAFKILGTQASDILRPSSWRELAVQAGEFLLNKGGVPNSFALEATPFMYLFGGTLSLAEYRNDFERILGLSRVSVATSASPLGGIDLAIGWRMTLLDYADPRLETGLDSRLWTLTDSMNAIYSRCRTKLGAFATQAQIDSCASTEITALRLNRIDTVIENFMERNWNRPIVDIGIAGLGRSGDSTFKGMRANKYQAWATYGLYIARKMQLVIGTSADISKDSLNTFYNASWNSGLRMYYGSNDLKGIIEANWSTIRNDKPSAGVNIGVEVAVQKGIWLDATYGAKSQSGSPLVFVPALSFKFGT